MSSSFSPIGMIGLGLMGSALAERLQTLGQQVVGFDVVPERGTGLERAASAAEVFARCELVFLSLPTHREVQAVLDLVEPHLRRGHLLVDTTTGEPAHTVTSAQRVAARGAHYLDATISGSSQQARQGDILWMVGGDSLAVDRCAGLLRQLGRELFHTGPPGSGARMKLVTNLALGLNRAALAESLAFAEALGLDAAESLRVLRHSAAYSRIMDTKGDKMLAREFSPQATLSQHLKDVRLLRAEADQLGLPLPLSAAHQALLEEAERRGLGALDNSAIIEVLRSAEGTP